MTALAEVNLSRTHKGAWSGGVGRVFPVPVVVHEKYLIEVHNERKFQLVLDLINARFLRDPRCFVFDRIHTDGETPVYRYQGELTLLAIVPLPEVDLEKSQKIEQLLSRSLFPKIGEEATAPSHEELAARLSKFLRLLENQRRCSSCERLQLQSAHTQSIADLVIKYFSDDQSVKEPVL